MNVLDKDTESDEKDEGKSKSLQAQYGAECLGIIVNLPTNRTKLFNYNTSYDSYMDFITEAKKEIPINELRKAFPHHKRFATHEMILTPSFVCFLAMRKLRKMFDLDGLPQIENIKEPPMKIKTKSDKVLLKQDPNNPTVFYPSSRDNIPSELNEFTRTVLNEIDIRERIKTL